MPRWRSTTGDILAFLPGMAEIRRTQAALADCGALVLPLHGELPPAEQDRALRPAERRRVVLATSIAETSLTVPGVRIVVDGGWRRAPRLDPSTGLTRLTTLRISRAAAEQRAGRAGREAPGVAIRLWSTALHRGLAALRPAGDPRGGVVGAGARLRRLGRRARPTCRFSTAPPHGALAAATALLTRAWRARRRQGASPTPARRMAALGAHPRLAAMMLAAGTPGETALAADLAALLEERDPLRSPDAPADIGLRLAAHRRRRSGRRSRRAVAYPPRSPRQYRRRLRLRPMRRADGDPGRLLAAAFPDRIAQRRGEPGSFRLAGGGGARLPRADPLASAPLLAVAALELKASARIRLAAPLDPDALPRPHRDHRAGGDQLRSGLRRSAGASAPAARRAGLADRTEPADPGRGRRGARPRGGGRRAATTALDRCRRASFQARVAPDATARTGRGLARPVGRRAGDRRAGVARAAAWRHVAPWPTWRGWT